MSLEAKKFFYLDWKKLIIPSLVFGLILAYPFYSFQLEKASFKDDKYYLSAVNDSLGPNAIGRDLLLNLEERNPDLYTNDAENRNISILRYESGRYHHPSKFEKTLTSIITSDLTLFTPEISSANQNSFSSIFRAESGYIEDISFINYCKYIYVSSKKFSSLEKSLEEDQITYNQTIQEINRLNDLKYNISEINLNRNIEKEYIPEKKCSYAHYNVKSWTELSLIHFIPAMIANFLIYYIFSGIIIEEIRKKR